MIEHKFIDNIEHKFCGNCNLWKELDEFGNHKDRNDGKKSYCTTCYDSMKIKCEIEGCDRLIRPSDYYCKKHDPRRCNVLNCTNKTYGKKNGLCDAHDPAQICIFNDCDTPKSKGYGDFCRKHAIKKYCITENCNKIQTQGEMCAQHFCEGNIERIALYLISSLKRVDTLMSNGNRENGSKISKKRLVPRTNNLVAIDIINLYQKSNKCHWCECILILSIGGEFNLDKISVDRVNSDIGHMSTNIVLSCLFCNYAKNNTNEKLWLEIIDILKGKNNIIDFSKHEFRINISKYCHNYKEITGSWVRDQLQNSNWKCSLSGLPLYSAMQNKFPWQISVDRIDNNGDHTTNNCQLVTSFINYGKNQMSNDEFKKYFKNKFPNIKIDKVIYPYKFVTEFGYGNNYPTNYIFFDFKTGGKTKDIIQLSYIVYNKNMQLLKLFNKYIKSKRAIQITNNNKYYVNGIEIQKLLESGSDFLYVLTEFANDVGDAKYIICNDELSIGVIKYNLNILKSIKHDPFIEKSIESISSLGKHLHKTHKLSQLYYKLFNTPVDDMNDAMVTTKMCCECYFALNNIHLDKKQKLINLYVFDIYNVNDHSIVLNNKLKLINQNIGLNVIPN
ncbi:MAG: hypothetical protein Edafosvirus9_2 [Edafosvirus sp.]|uniref:Uncharacterized protein n=1 Tax=Edafosvirus sp. TaxID=2487765 RepID=A0A3G4ZTS1_9VIRU|nr:MAG: hypothetical protein Edafosvirus9_2 [Edafosvirus sp.]